MSGEYEVWVTVSSTYKVRVHAENETEAHKVAVMNYDEDGQLIDMKFDVEMRG